MSNTKNDYARLVGMQMTPIQMADEITALRAALDVERAKVEKLQMTALKRAMLAYDNALDREREAAMEHTTRRNKLKDALNELKRARGELEKLMPDTRGIP